MESLTPVGLTCHIQPGPSHPLRRPAQLPPAPTVPCEAVLWEGLWEPGVAPLPFLQLFLP